MSGKPTRAAPKISISAASLVQKPRKSNAGGGLTSHRDIADSIAINAGAPASNNAMVIATAGAPGVGERLLTTSMKLKSLAEEIKEGGAIAMGVVAWPGESGAPDNNFTFDGKNMWNVAIAKALRDNVNLYFMPVDGILATEPALTKMMADKPNGKVSLYDIMRASREKKLGADSGLPFALPVHARALIGGKTKSGAEIPGRAVNLTNIFNEIAQVPKIAPEMAATRFGKIVASLVRYAHAMTSRLSATKAQEECLDRNPVTMMSANQLLSRYVTEDNGDAAPIRASATYTTLGHTLLSIRSEKRIKRAPEDQRQLVVDMAAVGTKKDAVAGPEEFRVSLRSLKKEPEPAPRKDGKSSIIARRYRMDLLLQHIGSRDQNLSREILMAMQAQVKEDLAKINKGQTEQEVMDDKEIKTLLLTGIHFAKISITEDGQNLAFHAFVLRSDGHHMMPQTRSAASILLYFFLRRFPNSPALMAASDALYKGILEDILRREVATGHDQQINRLMERLSQGFVQKAVSRAPAAVAKRGVSYVSEQEIEKLENASRQAQSNAFRAAARSSGARSQSPGRSGSAPSSRSSSVVAQQRGRANAYDGFDDDVVDARTASVSSVRKPAAPPAKPAAKQPAKEDMFPEDDAQNDEAAALVEEAFETQTKKPQQQAAPPAAPPKSAASDDEFEDAPPVRQAESTNNRGSSAGARASSAEGRAPVTTKRAAAPPAPAAEAAPAGEMADDWAVDN